MDIASRSCLPRSCCIARLSAAKLSRKPLRVCCKITGHFNCHCDKLISVHINTKKNGLEKSHFLVNSAHVQDIDNLSKFQGIGNFNKYLSFC